VDSPGTAGQQTTRRLHSCFTAVERVLTRLDCANRVQAALLVRDAGILPTAEGLR
jgi:hypothetical protein